jgi:hypothetical protein
MSITVLVAPLPGCLEGMEVNEKRKTLAANIGTMILSFIEIGLVKQYIFSRVGVEQRQDIANEAKIQAAMANSSSVNI